MSAPYGFNERGEPYLSPRAAADRIVQAIIAGEPAPAPECSPAHVDACSRLVDAALAILRHHAERVIRLPTKAERRAALARVPERLRPSVETYAQTLWRARS